MTAPASSRKASRPKRQPKPCSLDDMRRRIVRVLGFLPMSADDLHASAVRAPEDAGTFATMLLDMLSDGTVVPDPEPGRLALADPDGAA